MADGLGKNFHFSKIFFSHIFLRRALQLVSYKIITKIIFLSIVQETLEKDLILTEFKMFEENRIFHTT